MVLSVQPSLGSFQPSQIEAAFNQLDSNINQALAKDEVDQFVNSAATGASQPDKVLLSIAEIIMRLFESLMGGDNQITLDRLQKAASDAAAAEAEAEIEATEEQADTEAVDNPDASDPKAEVVDTPIRTLSPEPPAEDEQAAEPPVAEEQVQTTQIPAGQTEQPAPGPDLSALPPGLARRQQLPPGLAKRQQLPPGLAKRLNTQAGATEANNPATGQAAERSRGPSQGPGGNEQAQQDLSYAASGSQRGNKGRGKQ